MLSYANAARLGGVFFFRASVLAVPQQENPPLRPLLVPTELSCSALIFSPRGYRRFGVLTRLVFLFSDAELRKRRPLGRRFLFSRIGSCRSATRNPPLRPLLASCRTNSPPLKIVYFLHSHDQAENCTHREPGTGGGIRHSQIIARVYLSSRRCSALKRRLAACELLTERRVVPSSNRDKFNPVRSLIPSVPEPPRTRSENASVQSWALSLHG